MCAECWVWCAWVDGGWCRPQRSTLAASELGPKAGRPSLRLGRGYQIRWRWPSSIFSMGFIFSLRTAPFVTVQQRTTRRDRGLREAFIKNRRKWRPMASRMIPKVFPSGGSSAATVWRAFVRGFAERWADLDPRPFPRAHGQIAARGAAGLAATPELATDGREPHGAEVVYSRVPALGGSGRYTTHAPPPTIIVMVIGYR